MEGVVEGGKVISPATPPTRFCVPVAPWRVFARWLLEHDESPGLDREGRLDFCRWEKGTGGGVLVAILLQCGMM